MKRSAPSRGDRATATKTAPAPRAESATGVVRSALEDYAKRGVFSGFEEVTGQGGKTIFRFVWLHDRHMELTLEPSKKALRFDRFLPGVKPGSLFAGDLKRLLEKLTSNDMPDYRRVDPARAALSCSNRRDYLSIKIVVKKNDYQYAINRMVNVAHELFVYLRSDWPEYLAEYFNEPEE
jgi:hypothetical protein